MKLALVCFLVFLALISGCTSEIGKPYIHKSFITGQECDAVSGCREGQQCASFSRIDPTYYSPVCIEVPQNESPCRIVNCTPGTSCTVLESYPPQVTCT